MRKILLSVRFTVICGFAFLMILPAAWAQDKPSEPSQYTYHCENPKSREDADACSQRQSAEASLESIAVGKEQITIAWWGLIIGSASAIATVFAAFAAASAARAAADASKEALEANKLERAGRRAWIKIDVFPFSDVKLGEASQLETKVTLSLTNIGATPATSVKFHWKEFPDELIHDKTMANREQAITWLRKSITAPSIEHTILPGDNFSAEVTIEIAKTDNAVGIRIVVLVQYGVDGDADVHETLCDFIVIKIVDKSFRSIDGFVPVDQIAIKDAGRGIAS